MLVKGEVLKKYEAPTIRRLRNPILRTASDRAVPIPMLKKGFQDTQTPLYRFSPQDIEHLSWATPIHDPISESSRIVEVVLYTVNIQLQELVLQTDGTADQFLVVRLVSFFKNAGQCRN